MIDLNDIDDFFDLILEKTISIIDKVDHSGILKFNQYGNLGFATYENYGPPKIKILK